MEVNRPQPTTEAERRFCRGYALYIGGDLDTAIAEYTEAIILSAGAANSRPTLTPISDPVPTDGTYDRQHDTSLYGAGRIDAAAYSNRGVVYVRKREYERAIADYNAAIRIDPTFRLAYENRARIHIKIGDYDAAIADFNDALSSAPDYPHSAYERTYLGRAIAYHLAGKGVEAQQDFDRSRYVEIYGRAFENAMEHYLSGIGGVGRGGTRGNLCPDIY